MTTPTIGRLADKLAQSIHEDLASPLFRARERLRVFQGLRVTPTVTVDPEDGSMSFSFAAAAAPADIIATIERLLELPGQLAGDRHRRVVLVLDEFQEIVDIDPGLPRLMRSVFQRQPEVSHIYLGSRRHTLERIFNDENEPFWRSAKRTELGLIALDAFRPFIAERFETTGRAIDGAALDLVLSTSRGHPYATQELCYFLWQRSGDGGTATVADAQSAIADVLRSEDSHFASVWDNASTQQRVLLQALASEEGRPFSTEYRRRHGLPGTSSIQRALAQARGCRARLALRGPRVDQRAVSRPMVALEDRLKSRTAILRPMLRIAVLDDYQRRAREFADWDSLGPGADVMFFHEAIDRSALPATLADFDVLVLMRERTVFPREVLERLPNLQLLVTTGMRNASVDVDYLHQRGVSSQGPVVPARRRRRSAEHRGGGVGAHLRRPQARDDRGPGRARRDPGSSDLPRNLAGATLGLAGLGRLGGSMVAPARVFGMDVIAWSENLTDERTAELGVRKVSKAELLESSDVLSIHLVLSDRTRGLFGAADLALMKPTAVLINTSRGPIVDEPALIEALRTRQIAAAGLDVFDREPLPADHELLELENTVLLPHLGYVNEAALRTMYGQVVEDIAAFRAGAPIRVVD